MIGVNQAIVRATSLEVLFQETCQICCASGGFDLAWIGVPSPEGDRLMVLAAQGALASYTRGLLISLTPESPFAQGITGSCFLAGSSTVCHDWDTEARVAPWRSKGQEHGIRASAAVPIVQQGRVTATLTLYSRHPAFFQPDRMELLKGLAGDLSIAMEKLAREAESVRNLAEAGRHQDEIAQLNAHLELRVKERTLQLEEANRELNSFAYSISHDLRAPLRHITAFSVLLSGQLGEQPYEQADKQKAAKAAGYLEVIQAAARRMDQHIKDLLSFSNLGLQPLRKTRLELNTILQGVLEQLQPELGDRKVRWRVGALPPLQGDGGLLFFLFQNMLSNAVKYTRKKPEAVIEIMAIEGQPGWVGFSVKDNGVGFDPAQAHRLFGLFQRLHRQDEFEGSGIGLANAQRIVARHGGQIRAESTLGEGATFYVTFPVG